VEKIAGNEEIHNFLAFTK